MMYIYETIEFASLFCFHLFLGFEETFHWINIRHYFKKIFKKGPELQEKKGKYNSH